MKHKMLLVLLLALVPVLAQSANFSALTVREVGTFISTLPADWHGVAPAAAKAQIDAIQPFILDIREVAEFREGHIAGAVNIPLRTLPANIAKVPRDRPIIVYCRIGHRGALALPFLRGQGYNARSLMGGLNAWTAANLPVVRP
ncbi:rhodanese-like domain-containing protein [uncultured Meiothermus sp.]|jgi:rhodanese-related sulfurtransferase|uniref:rhodanese-like domain-containing protein n=1 Tax=uncultured Meiothermus sp. TaxID=157471 RepID=UPI00262A893A|nr:rhodanese-like domain-containing protein [uncultured Meiothermus sp.]